MEANVRFFPIGNADTCVIDSGGRKFVFDFAAPTPQGGTIVGSTWRRRFVLSLRRRIATALM